MATYYVQARKLGPVQTFQIAANSRAQAMSNLVLSAGPGEEYQILDGSTLLAATGTTGGTGPSGITGSS
jgi:hypothetical protein